MQEQFQYVADSFCLNNECNKLELSISVLIKTAVT